MTGKAFMNAVPSLAHILFLTSFASDTVNKVIALACYILFALIISIGFGTGDSPRFVEHGAENTFNVAAFIYIFTAWFSLTGDGFWYFCSDQHVFQIFWSS